jgi:2'-5' RNA ligase
MMGDKAMIALLPSNAEEWGAHVDFPHLTLVYAGEELNFQRFNELAKDASMLALFARPFHLVVKARERFGSELDVDVYTLQPTPYLWALRRAVEQWNASDQSFIPHVTIGSPDVRIEYPPKAIRFSKIAASWGDHRIIFGFDSYD